MERSNLDPNAQLREAMDQALRKVNTCLPGVIESFDAATQTVKVVPAIKGKILLDGVVQYHELPPLIEVPVMFPYSSTLGLSVSIPIVPGDNCILVFSQRAIDNWYAQGGIQPPETDAGSRHHSLTDAFAIPAGAPLPDAVSSYQTDAIEIRNSDRTTRVSVKANEAKIVCGAASFTLSPDGTGLFAGTLLKSTAPVEFTNGLLVSGGTVKGPADVDLLTHRHNETSTITEAPRT